MTILPGGCCYGNTSATAMIAHSCLINWFFNAPWYVRTLQVHWIWENNGFSFSFLLAQSCLTSNFAVAISSCFMKYTDVSYRMGEDTAWLFEMQTECFFFFFFSPRCLLWAAAAAHTESNAMWILCLFKAALLQNYSVVHFIPAIYWDQLWLESQAFISEPLLVFIKTSYARACSIWSF